MLQKDDSEILSAFPFPEEFMSQGGRDHCRVTTAPVTKEMASHPGKGPRVGQLLGGWRLPWQEERSWLHAEL